MLGSAALASRLVCLVRLTFSARTPTRTRLSSFRLPPTREWTQDCDHQGARLDCESPLILKTLCATRPYDVVIGADVLYDKKLTDALGDTLEVVLNDPRSPTTTDGQPRRCLLSDPPQRSHRKRLCRSGLDVTEMPLLGPERMILAAFRSRGVRVCEMRLAFETCTTHALVAQPATCASGADVRRATRPLCAARRGVPADARSLARRDCGPRADATKESSLTDELSSEQSWSAEGRSQFAVRSSGTLAVVHLLSSE